MGHPDMLTEADAARQYVNSGPPFIGESHFRDKDAVKANGGRWNSDHKKWEARTIESLRALITSRKWTPCGFTATASYYMIEHIDKGGYAPAVVGTPVAVGKLLFDRRGEEDSKFDPEKDQEVLPNGKTATYARHCKICGILVDSRLQFGLECDCGGLWTSCNTCSLPLRLNEKCPTC